MSDETRKARGRRHGASAAPPEAREPFWRQYWKQIIGGLVTAFAAMVGVVLSPLGPALQRLIYPEAVEITVRASTTQVRHNEEFSLTAIARRTSLVPAAEGQVEVEFDPQVIRYVGEENLLLRKTPKIDESTNLYDKPPRFRAVADQGKADVIVRLKTSSGYTFEGMTSVQIVPAEVQGRRPTRENFVGEWVIQIGDLQGLMKVTSQSQEGHGKLQGSYELHGPGAETWQGAFDYVTKDGKTFVGPFNAAPGSSGPKLMAVSAAFCLDDDGYIKIEGTAKDEGSGLCRDFSAWAEAEQGEKNCVENRRVPRCSPS
jgi:hypothetical protein